MFSIFSFLIAVIWLNITFLLISFLRRQTLFLVRYSTPLLFLCLILGVIRIVLPLDLPFAFVIRSFEVLPSIQRNLGLDVIPGSLYLGLGMLLILIWATSSVFVVVKSIFAFHVGQKNRQHYRIAENEQATRISSTLGMNHCIITVSPDVIVPCVTGIFTAHIYLPALVLSDEKLIFILKHEYQHFKSHDVLIKVFYLLLLALFWWNPIVHIFQKELERLLELRCDANVTRHMDDESKIEYLEDIIFIVKQVSIVKEPEYSLSAMPLVNVGANNFLKQRFQITLESLPRAKKSQVFIFALIIFLFISSFMIVLQPAGFPSEEDMEGGVVVDPEKAYILVKYDGTMVLYVNGEYLWVVTEERLYDEPHSNLPIYYEGEE